MNKKKLLKALTRPALTSLDDAIKTAAGTAALIIERDKILAEKNNTVENAGLPFSVQIDEMNSRIAANERALIAWAIKNRKAYFADSKTLGLAGHKLAFREGTGKVATTEDSSEEDAIDSIINAEDETLLARFITVKPALNKNAVIAALRAGGETGAFLKSIGLILSKEEKCKFEPDLDIAPPSEEAAA